MSPPSTSLDQINHNLPKVGINGFGRIGRFVTRIALKSGIQIVAINDPLIDLKYMHYMFKYDSTHGPYDGSVEMEDDQLVIDGQPITVFNEENPGNIDWASSGAVYVIEASGLFTTIDSARMHMQGGCHSVIVTSTTVDAPMIVIGVNEGIYDSRVMSIVSAASSTTNCLAVLVKVIHDKYTITEGLVTVLHPYTSSQKIVDGPFFKDWRAGRGCANNVIPANTNAARAVGKIIPSLDGKLQGIAFRVPVHNVSVVDLTCRIETAAPFDDIKATLKAASETGPLLGILGYTDEMVVSTDFISSSCSCIFDAEASIGLDDNFIKLVAWYDNEYAYSCRVIDLIKFIHSKSHSVRYGPELPKTTSLE